MAHIPEDEAIKGLIWSPEVLSTRSGEISLQLRCKPICTEDLQS